MTSKERMRITMQNKKPDRVPVMCQQSLGHIMLNTGIRPSDFIFNPRYFAQGLLEMREKYNFDGILINQYSNKPEEFRSQLKIEYVDDGDLCCLINGDKIFCPNYDDPRDYPSKPVAKPDIEDVDPGSVDYELDIPDWKVEAHKIVIENAGKEYSIHGEVPSPFDGLIVFLGIENALVALLTDHQKCKELMVGYTEKSFSFAKAQIELGVDAMKISSPFAGSSFISPSCYREFILPFEKKLVDKIHKIKPELPVYTHTCGSIDDRLEIMAESGINGIECLDPAPLGNVGLSDAKRRIGKRLFIKGNMDSVNVLLNATEEIMEEYVKKQIYDGAANGGYILSSACSIAPRVKPEMLKMLVPLAEKYGKY